MIEFVSSRRNRGILVAAEGLDASGKSAGLEQLARWIERKGRRVEIVPWQPSRTVRRAAQSPRGRVWLTPRVAALLGAADARRLARREIQPQLDRGTVVLADRYVWTAVAREGARGLDLDWASALYEGCPAPDLVLFYRQEPAVALRRALATRPGEIRAAAIGSPLGAFLRDLDAAYRELAAAASAPAAKPWLVAVVELDAREPSSSLERRARDAVRPLLASAHSRNARSAPGEAVA